MTLSSPISRQVCFGEFTLDPETAELRKNGNLSTLQGQPFQILLILLEQPGRLVTRDELKKRLWPSDTFVDFDHGLNKAVNRLREALEDSANNPKFKETRPRRGYRFIGTLEEAAVPLQPTGSSEKHVIKKRLSPVYWRGLCAALGIITIAGVGTYLYSHRGPVLNEKDTIVLSDFINTTGDSAFDGTLRQGLSVQLEQSPFLSLVSDDRIQQTLQMMGREPDTKLTPQLAREVCERLGSKAYLSGSIANLGNQFVIALNAMNCLTADSLAKEQVTADNKENVLRALDKAAAQLRKRLGESLPSLRKFDVPIEQATTTSFEALKAFSLGDSAFHSADGPRSAIPFYERAIELDPKFAMAHLGLGICYLNLSEPNLAFASLERAYELRNHATEVERFTIETCFQNYALGDKEKGTQTLELYAKTYPRELSPRVNLAINYLELGRLDNALAEGLDSVRLDPSEVAAYPNLMWAYLSLNRLDDAKTLYQRALAANLHYGELNLVRYLIAFLEADATEMGRQAAWSSGKQGVENYFLFNESMVEACRGHSKKARELLRGAVDSAKRSDENETAAAYLAGAATTEADYGNSERALQQVASALSLASTRDVLTKAALGLARAGDSARAQKMADELARQYPQNTLINAVSVPTIRAAVEMNRNNPSKAIEFLRTVTPYELGFADFLYSTYLRGLAYLRLRQGKEAAAEFQRILEHPGVVLNNSQGTIAHLGLARAYVLSENPTEAGAAYQAFFTLWKDADPDIPILKEAKAEYAKLQ